MKNWSRKDFLSTSLIASGAALLARGRAAAAVAPAGSPNGDIRVAIVGFRSKGATHIKAFHEIPGARIVALCDVDSDVLAHQVQLAEKRGEKVTAYRDYRKLLEDPTIDAVIIATPNHWHSLMAIWACQAGKDVYVEKPVCHNVWEGRKVVEAAAKYNRIVQIGTQGRSDEAVREAIAYVQAGNLGAIQWVRGLCYKARPSIGKTTGPQAVSKTIDYDLWSGPAPLVAPRRNGPGNGTVHYDWHWFWNYGGGDITNQGVHEMDMSRWALGQEGLPPTVMTIGGRFGYEDDAETPNTLFTVMDYKPAPLIFEVRGLPHASNMRAMDAYRGVRVGFTVHCEHGYFAGGASGGGVFDLKGKKIKQFSGPGGGGHQANFIAAVRSRKMSDLHAPVDKCYISSALCAVGNISYRLGQDTAIPAVQTAVESHALTKDSLARMLDHLRANGVATQTTPAVVGPLLSTEPGQEKFVSGEKYDVGFWANGLLRRQYRPPFVVPETV